VITDAGCHRDLVGVDVLCPVAVQVNDHDPWEHDEVTAIRPTLDEANEGGWTLRCATTQPFS
jgi:hypothetical protein